MQVIDRAFVRDLMPARDQGGHKGTFGKVYLLGGSGDVLTGLLTGLLAQGMEPFDACCAAVWIHGRAGDMAAEEKGRRGMTPADMIEKLPYALKEVE